MMRRHILTKPYQSAVRAWQQSPWWLRGGSGALLGLILLFLLLFQGYCWGWWARDRLLTQYLFQAACPARSEQVRYQPFRLLVPATADPRFFDVSPSGRFIVYAEQQPRFRVIRLEVQTGQRVALTMQPTGLIRFLDDDRLLAVDPRLPANNNYVVVDVPTNTQTHIQAIDVVFNLRQSQRRLDQATLQRLRGATEAIAVQGFMVVLAPDYRQHPQQNIVLAGGSLDDRQQLMQQLSEINVQNITVVSPQSAQKAIGSQGLEDRWVAPYGRVWATPFGLYDNVTQQQIIAISWTQQYTAEGFSPEGWVQGGNGFIYDRPPTYVIDLGMDAVFASLFLYTRQPLLLLDVPPPYRTTPAP